MSNQPWWVFGLLSALFAALTTLFAKIGLQGVNSNVATAVRTVVILFIAWGIVLFRGEWPGWQVLGGKTLLFLVLSGVATGLSWLAYFRALALGPAGSVAAVDKSSIVLVLLLAALFFGEPLTWRSAGAIGLIVAGTLLLIR